MSTEHIVDDDTTYQEQVIQGALNAVVAAGSVDGESGGYVDFDAAVNRLCDAIATLEAAAGLGKSAMVRRKTADRCRQRIIATGSRLARMAEAGEPLGWTLTPVGLRN